MAIKRSMRTRLISSVLGEQKREGERREKELEAAERARRIQGERKSWWSLAGQLVGGLFGPAQVLVGMGIGKLIGDLGTVGGKQAEEYKVSTNTGAWGGTEESEMLAKINERLTAADKSELGQDVLDIGKKGVSLFGARALESMKSGDWSDFSLTKYKGGKSGFDKLKDMFGKGPETFDFTKNLKPGEIAPIEDTMYNIKTGEPMLTVPQEGIPSFGEFQDASAKQTFESLGLDSPYQPSLISRDVLEEKVADITATKALEKEYRFPSIAYEDPANLSEEGLNWLEAIDESGQSPDDFFTPGGEQIYKEQQFMADMPETLIDESGFMGDMQIKEMLEERLPLTSFQPPISEQYQATKQWQETMETLLADKQAREMGPPAPMIEQFPLEPTYNPYIGRYGTREDYQASKDRIANMGWIGDIFSK